MKPVLSISIPTYAAPKEVIENVKRLLKCRRDDIEIVVVDNDPTGEQIKDFMLSIDDPRFRYYQNEENIGRSNNIVRAIEVAAADYVYLCSSEDEIYLESIDTIIGIISKEKECAIIVGNIETNFGKNHFDFSKEKFKKGFDALWNIPSMGNLVPIVINKMYLDIPELYSVEETYMQQRILYVIGASGDLIFSGTEFGKIPDNDSYRYTLPPQEQITSDISKNNFGKTKCYYHPYERAVQLKGFLEIIEKKYSLDTRQMLKVVDNWIAPKIGSARDYVFQCQDLFLRRPMYPPIMGYNEAFDLFYNEISGYFQKKEEEGKYSYLGKLKDRISNEKILLHKADEILKQIQGDEIVYIYNAEIVEKRLYLLLKAIGINIKGFIADSLKDQSITQKLFYPMSEIDKDSVVLIPYYYDQEIEHNLTEHGIKKYHFFNELHVYLSVVWCDMHQDESNFGEYSKYVFEKIDDTEIA